jgi:hypothetical protein
MDRRQILAIGIASSSMQLSGCVTSRLHETTSYTERIGGVFVSSDRKSIVILGEKYHYIFDAPSQVLAALDPILHPEIRKAEFSSFNVNSNNEIYGSVNLYASGKLNKQQEELALKAGFIFNGSDQAQARVRMQGKRYRAKESEKPVVQRLNKEYFVTVNEDPSIAGAALKVAATPVAIAADGALILGAVVLSPIWIPIFLSNACFICK